jgi:predicted transcriptional regulator
MANSSPARRLASRTASRKAESVRLTLEISPDLNNTLEELAGATHGTKSDVLRKAIALMQVAVRAKTEGKKFGIAEAHQQLSTEVVGI